MSQPRCLQVDLNKNAGGWRVHHSDSAVLSSAVLPVSNAVEKKKHKMALSIKSAEEGNIILVQ